MAYSDAVIYARMQTPFRTVKKYNISFNSHERETLKRLVRMKRVMNKINKRSNIKRGYNIQRIFDLLLGVFQIIDDYYDSSMVNQSTDTLLNQYLLSSGKNLYKKTRTRTQQYPNGKAKSTQYISDMKNASKINKYIHKTKNEMLIRNLTMNKKNFVDICLEKYPITTYLEDELQLLIEIFNFSSTIKTFTIHNVNNYHKVPNSMRTSYLDLANYLDQNKQETSEERFYLPTIISNTKITNMTYRKADVFLKKSFDKRLLSLWDKKYIKSKLPNVKLAHILNTLDKMIELQKK